MITACKRFLVVAVLVVVLLVALLVATRWRNRVTESRLDTLFTDNQGVEQFERILAKQRAEDAVREAARKEEIQKRQETFDAAAKAFAGLIGGTP